MSNDFFEIRDSEINVEDIMAQIRKNIKERNKQKSERRQKGRKKE
mgnify:CR=1 FL=1